MEKKFIVTDPESGVSKTVICETAMTSREVFELFAKDAPHLAPISKFWEGFFSALLYSGLAEYGVPWEPEKVIPINKTPQDPPL